MVAEDLDVSLLLAVEGMNLDDSTDTRANLLAALSRSPELIASTRGGAVPLVSLASSPDGKVVGVGQIHGGVSFYDTTTRQLRGTFDEMPVWKFGFRPDGKQLVFTSRGEGVDPSVRLVDPTTLMDEPVQLGDVPTQALPSAPHYSVDGRFLAISFQDFTAGVVGDTSVIVWDVAAPQHPVRRVDMTGGPYELALSRDGGTLYVGHADPPSVTAYNVATGQVLRSANVPGSSLSRARTASLAVAGGNEIVLLDAATFAERRRLEGHAAAIQVIRFSASGALLASGSDDRTAIVWDVATGQHRDPLRGYSSSVFGVGFNPSEDTLYTTSGYSILTWDLVGDRRFVAHRPLSHAVMVAAYEVFRADDVAERLARRRHGGLHGVRAARRRRSHGAAPVPRHRLRPGRRVIDTNHGSYGATAGDLTGTVSRQPAKTDPFAGDLHTSELVVERHPLGEHRRIELQRRRQAPGSPNVPARCTPLTPKPSIPRAVRATSVLVGS